MSGCGFYSLLSHEVREKGKKLWKKKLVHLLSPGGLVTTAPTVIQSTTPIKQKMAVTTITIMSHHFISSKRGKNIKVLLHIPTEKCCYMSHKTVSK